MSELETIWRKAKRLASETDDAETMQKAVETARIAHELQRKEKETKWVRAAQDWATLVTSSTVIVSLITIAVQLYQFRKSSTAQEEQFHRTAEEQRMAAATSQWREALKNVSFKDDSSVLSSAMQMQSFFSYEPYSAQSRSMAATLLPYVTSGPAFDAVVDQLRSTSNVANQKDLISVMQLVVDEDWDLYSKAVKHGSGKSFAEFMEDPTGMIPEGTHLSVEDARRLSVTENQSERDRWYNPLKLALICSYNADSISKAMARLWREKKEMNPGPAKLALSGIVLENSDLRQIDFSGVNLKGTLINKCNLTGANLSGTTLKDAILNDTALKDAVLTGITAFDGSKWNGTSWWDASKMDCALAEYLHRNFPASHEASAKAESLFKNSCGSLGDPTRLPH
jgi:hypothetical protein